MRDAAEHEHEPIHGSLPVAIPPFMMPFIHARLFCSVPFCTRSSTVCN